MKYTKLPKMQKTPSKLKKNKTSTFCLRSSMSEIKGYMECDIYQVLKYKTYTSERYTSNKYLVNVKFAAL